MPHIGEELEERCLRFASATSGFIGRLPRTVAGFEHGKQLARSSASVGANYIEANESCSKKDFILRIRTSLKEAKESCYWFRLISVSADMEETRTQLLKECIELKLIFGAILRNTLQKREKRT